MKKLIAILLILSLSIQCSEDESTPVPVEPLEAPKVTKFFVDDVTNNGNGSDLEVSIIAAPDETLISEYRVFVVKSTNRTIFSNRTRNTYYYSQITKKLNTFFLCISEKNESIYNMIYFYWYK